MSMESDGGVPAPRQPLDPHCSGDGWRYHHRGKRDADVTFDGYVTLIDGEAAAHMLGEFGAVLRELLEWAYDEQQSSGQGGVNDHE